MKQKCFYSVVDLNKAMPKQNLFPFRVIWNNNQILIQNLLWFFFLQLKKKEFLFMKVYWYIPANVDLFGQIEHI